MIEKSLSVRKAKVTTERERILKMREILSNNPIKDNPKNAQASNVTIQ